MKLCYEITKTQYLELLARQMSKKNRLLPNLLFMAIAIWFCIFRVDYAGWARAVVLGMSVFLVGLSFYKKNHGEYFAEEAFQRLLKQGVLKESFLGEHTLSIENGMLLRSYGGYCDEIPCKSVTLLKQMNHSTVIFVGKIMFELIPNEILNLDNNFSNLENVINA